VKTCTKCLQSKDITSFTKRVRSKDGLDMWCKTCKSNHEKTRNYAPNYHGTKTCTSCLIEKPKVDFGIDKRKQGGIDTRCFSCNVKRSYATGIKRKYSITKEQVDQMKLKQNNCCAICKNKETSKKAINLSIDHDHSSGKVRGLLCNNCNNGLGRFKDDCNLLQAAIDYLKEQHVN